jgi:hypothetical protein
MTPDPKYVLQLAQELETAKTQVAELQAKWDALFTSATPAEGGSKGGRRRAPEGIASRALALINSAPDEHFDANMVARRLECTRKQAEKALNNLYAASKISRFSRGCYEAKTSPVSGDQPNLLSAVA